MIYRKQPKKDGSLRRKAGSFISFEVWVLGLSALAAVLLWPLRGLSETIPVVPFLGALMLFFVPGALVSRWFFEDRFPGTALVPLSFVVSASIFALLGIPMLVTHQKIEAYLLLCGIIVGASLGWALLKVLRRRTTTSGFSGELSGTSLLWVPFLGMAAGLAYVSTTKVPQLNDDVWNYTAYVREHLSGGRLAVYDPYFGHKLDALSRVKINGWLLELAGLSKLSGVDPIVMVFKLLAPALIFVILLAFYALGRVLFKSEGAALFAGCLYELFFLTHLSASQLTFGGEFIARVTEDKFLARFVFLPVALCLAVAFLESRRWRYLWVFGLACWAVVAVHPIGLAIIGLCMAGFGLAHVLVNWRKLEAWVRMAALGVATISIVVFPAVYLLLAGESLWSVAVTADINGTPTKVLNNMVFLWPQKKRIVTLGHDLYIMHPAILIVPPIAAAYVLGVPFLLWRIRRSVGAQLLFGALALLSIVLYVPWIATFFVDNIIGPGQLYRLAWPIPLIAFLTLGWVVWEIMKWVQGFIGKKVEVMRPAMMFLPLAVVLSLLVVYTPTAIAGARNVYATNHPPLSVGYGYDPVFRWMQHNIKKQSVVLAPDPENICIPAYSAKLNVVSLRGAPIISHLPGLKRLTNGNIHVPKRDWAVHNFFHHGTSMKDRFRILRHYKVDYVLVNKKSPLDDQLPHLSGFRSINVPSERYSLYAVDRSKLGA